MRPLDAAPVSKHAYWEGLSVLDSSCRNCEVVFYPLLCTPVNLLGVCLQSPGSSGAYCLGYTQATKVLSMMHTHEAFLSLLATRINATFLWALQYGVLTLL